ncbi:MAG TPA: bifunctional 2-C-methyl-D-erythritol 4-phosphate cytidylyltransferase/2-C-methyl-D-erythritol 2,4-cyclodiphosphate synthase [Caulobacteraceae bacterium]|nr:bifunctional 2-C-methyl-D-erythritol 4-phosphate cytidylyltransferase/2-C-methyl-D-erythritol 2,4-cyclodiphosphate synthase [Caulobacteraceae bacterium]
MDFVAVIVAAGAGVRAGGPKQWRDLAGRPVARWSLEALLGAGARHVAVVIRAGDEGVAAAAFTGLGSWSAVVGGADRADSVRAGLTALAPLAPEAVMIHDAARPLLSERVIYALLEALAEHDGAIPSLPIVDTLKRRGVAGTLTTASREGLLRAQTPQAFRFATLVEAWTRWPAGDVPTDDAQVLEHAGGTVAAIAGDPRLIKLTHPEDFAMAEALAAAARQTRIGQGFDVHAFGPGDHVWLCGVRIDHDRALLGHSDADAGLHALTDAMLGAIGEGDIGDHFPPSDQQWKGVASSIFIEHARDLIAHRGGRIVNVDVTLICEEPRIKPHRAAMRERVADLLRISLDRVSVKATTTETLGFAGRREGLAAQAAAAVEMPA